MTFEERIDRITERQEALVQSAELLLLESVKHDQRIDKLLKVTEKHSEQLALDGEHIRALVRIVEIHHERLQSLENGNQQN